MRHYRLRLELHEVDKSGDVVDQIPIGRKSHYFKISGLRSLEDSKYVKESNDNLRFEIKKMIDSILGILHSYSRESLNIVYGGKFK